MSTDNYNADRTPTPRTRSRQSSLESLSTVNNFASDSIVYIVTDIIYPTHHDFALNKGVFRIDSCHSSRKNANARARRIIYEGGQIDGGQYNVDLDKILEETKKGLFTGIGVGGKGDGREMGCYARKCQVERKIVDADSEDESEESEVGRPEERGWDRHMDGDIQMG
jgi:hypothetical protein